MKRIRYEVRYSRKERCWWFYRGAEKRRGPFPRKILAVRYAAKIGSGLWHNIGELSELTIKRKDGTVQDCRTYGRDPRGIRG